MTRVTAELIHPDDPRWRAVLADTLHDVYHLPDYLRFSAWHEGGEPCAFYADSGGERFLAPLLLRALPDWLEAPAWWRDATTPYGYGSPLVTGARDDTTIAMFLRALTRVVAEAGVVSAFFRIHPLLPLGSLPADLGVLAEHGPTVWVDLSLSHEEMWSQTRANHRSGINKLRRAGYQVRVDDWTLYSEFRRIYGSTMERVGASGFYFFSEGYFEDLRSTLGNMVHLFAVVSPDGEVASAGLFFAGGQIVQYHLGGTNARFLRAAPSKMMFDAVRSWGKENGYHWLSLGGGLGGAADALFDFKAGFSPVRHAFHTYRMILDREKYATLRTRWLVCGGREEPHGSLFPQYRAAVSQPHDAVGRGCEGVMLIDDAAEVHGSAS